LIATIGCDGTLHFCSIKDGKLLAKIPKIAKKQTDLQSQQLFEVTWSESGDHLYIAGDTSLIVVARSDLKTYTVA
jgi:hypothetical protein